MFLKIFIKILEFLIFFLLNYLLQGSINSTHFRYHHRLVGKKHSYLNFYYHHYYYYYFLLDLIHNFPYFVYWLLATNEHYFLKLFFLIAPFVRKKNISMFLYIPLYVFSRNSSTYKIQRNIHTSHMIQFLTNLLILNHNIK